jgi:hypothetical protein
MSNLSSNQTKNKEFLEHLKLLGCNYGWSGDYNEVAEFIRWCYAFYGEEEPTKEELKPVDET